jgi:EmrB/QacA subfamily drug resistance transporter
MDMNDSKRAALMVAVAGSFVTPFMGSSINVALPAIAREFRMDAVLLSWIATSFLLAAAAFLVPLGKLGDIHGRKKVYTAGMVVFTLASLLSAGSLSAHMLILFRVCQGIGAAMIFSTGMAILTSVFPPEERGKALGISVAATYIGLSAGPFIGGLVTEHFSWRGVFLVNVPIGITAISLIFFKLKGEWAEARGEKFDLVGSLIYGVSLAALMYGVSLAPETASLWLICASMAGAAAFVTWETNSRNPVFDLNLFRANRIFAFSSLAALLHYGATFGVTFLLSMYLQHVKGLSPQSTGLVLVTQPAIMALFSPLAGRISDRIEPRIVASAGMGFTAAGLLALAFLQEEWPLSSIIAVLVVLGFGFAFFSSPNMNAIMSSVERRFYGLASGSVGTMRLLGQMLSMGTATLIFAVVIGRVEIAPQHHVVLVKSLHYAFFVFSGLCVIGILLSLARGELRSGPPIESRSQVHARGTLSGEASRESELS